MLTLALLWVSAHAATPLQSLHTTLSVRHDPPSCDELAEDLAPEVFRDAMITLAETVETPPWVPMRAASCVVSLAASDREASDAATSWLQDPDRAGLALVVVQGLDDLDLATSTPLADHALHRLSWDERFARYALPRLISSNSPSIAEQARRAAAERSGY